MKTTKAKKIHLPTIIIFLCVIGVIVSLVFRIQRNYKASQPQILTSSYLSEAINVSSLSTAQFTYNGIAEVYKDDSIEQIKCHILYNAKVKAGIDMSKVTFDIDNDDMTVKPILPDIQITANLIDEVSLSFIPASTTMEISDALEICKNDAENEAVSSTKLMETAEDNLHSVIEALLSPIIAKEGYSLIW